MKTPLALCFAALALTASAADFPPINSPASTDSFPGKFVWSDLYTADSAAAQSFYTGLFGWTATTIQRDTSSGVHPYVVLSNGDRPVGGIAVRPPRLKDEVHGVWVGYISVPDVAKAVATATAAGGHVLFPVRDLPARGTQAIILDPEGALVGLLHSSSGDPGEYRPDPGDWMWAEMFAKNPDAAGHFYEQVLSYQLVVDQAGEGQPKHTVLVSGGYSRGSIGPLSSRPRARAAWLMFVRVANVKATVAQATRLGGHVLVAPSDAPTEYWRAVVADPTGAAIGLVQLDEAAAVAAKEMP